MPVETCGLVGAIEAARLWGEASRGWIALFYALALAGFAAAGAAAGLGWPYWIALVAAGTQLAWQLRGFSADDPADCLMRFRSNRWIGWILFAGIVAAQLLQA